MSAPKYNGSYQANGNQQKTPVAKSATVCKPVTTVPGVVECCNRISAIIKQMENDGYEYYEHMNISSNEKILIFKYK